MAPAHAMVIQYPNPSSENGMLDISFLSLYDNIIVSIMIPALIFAPYVTIRTVNPN